MTNAVRSKETEIAVYLGLGSNLGDREANLREAIERIKALGLKINWESSVYETEPVGFHDQPWFLNQVIETSTLAGPSSKQRPSLDDPQTGATKQAEDLLSELLRIELEMGRQRTLANGPRVIDIDLLLFGNMIIGYPNPELDPSKQSKEWLIVPHQRMHLRRFVLEPMCEIGADVVHPVLNKTCSELLASLENASQIRRFGHRSASVPRLDQLE